jgi:hypothetical protein
MPRVAITADVSSRGGTALSAEVNGDPVNFHQITNTGNTKLLIRNSGAVSRTVTIIFSKTVDGQTVTNRTKAIAAGATEVFGPFSIEEYGTTLLFNVDNAELKIRAIE